MSAPQHASDPAQLLRMFQRNSHHEGNGHRVYVADDSGFDWEPPTPLADVYRLLFPIDSLRGFDPFAPFARALSESTQTPIDLPATVCLGTLSAAAGGKFEVEVEPGYVEPSHLYFLTLLQSGSRKSAVFRQSNAPILAWERERIPEDRKHRAVWESRKRVDEAALKQLEGKLASPSRPQGNSNQPESRSEMALQAEELARHLATDRPPRITQVIADDVTAERLTGLLAEQEGAVAVMSAEGGFFGNIGGRYNSMPTLDTMLKAHAGDDIRVDRQGRPGEIVPRPALTICIAAQPAIANELGKIPGFRGKGAAARFLVSMPASNLGQRKVSVPPMPPDVVSAWSRCVTRLLNMTALTRSAEDGYPIPRLLQLSSSAHASHLQYRKEVEDELGEAGMFADMTDWASKLPGAAARIAGLLHLLTTPEGTEPEVVPITGPTMEAAIAISDYFASHALIFFDALAGDTGSSLSAARIVLDELCAMADDAGEASFSVTRRTVNQRLGKRKRFKKAASLDEPIERLETHGFIVVTSEHTGGRPKETIHLNPCARKGQKGQKGGAA